MTCIVQSWHIIVIKIGFHNIFGTFSIISITVIIWSCKKAVVSCIKIFINQEANILSVYYDHNLNEFDTATINISSRIIWGTEMEYLALKLIYISTVCILYSANAPDWSLSSSGKKVILIEQQCLLLQWWIEVFSVNIQVAAFSEHLAPFQQPSHP